MFTQPAILMLPTQILDNNRSASKRIKTADLLKTPQGRLREERGAAYVLAITTLIVGLTLALALLRSANGLFISESGRVDVGQAKYAAEAGVDYAAWRVLTKHTALPYTADVTLTGKSFHVTAVDDSARAAHAVLITSVGTAAGTTYKRKRVVETVDPLPYDYVWCQSTNINSPQTTIVTTATRGIRANGTINMPSGGNDITEGTWATGSINTSGTVTPKCPNSASVTFPAIDNNHYRFAANIYYNSDHTFYDGQLSYAQPTLIFVEGIATLQCHNYTGMVTIVASGTIKQTVDIVAANQNSYLALISTVGFDTSNTSVHSLQAVVYVHNSTKTANARWRDIMHFTGSVGMDTVTVAGVSATFDTDFRVSHSILQQLQLPGL
jgi:hypothetical protein